MGRWIRRNPGLPREEIARRKDEARALFLSIARERSWLPNWEFDSPDYLECCFFPGNPGLDATLTLCFSYGGLTWWAEPPGADWFEAGDPAGHEAFLRSMNEWLDAEGGGSARV